MTQEQIIDELTSYAEHSRGSLSESFRVAITSIQKQIPKDIKIFDYGKAHCPICETDIHGIGKINYCFKCGQRINWK